MNELPSSSEISNTGVENQLLLNTEGENTPSFSLNERNIYLTYSQCPLPMEEVYSQLEYILVHVYDHAISQYMVGEELHKDGNLHTHVLITLKKRIHIRNSRVLDLKSEFGNVYHPNFGGTVRNRARVLKYCMKDGKYITNIPVGELPSIAKNTWERAILKAKEKKTKEALDIVMTEAPRDWSLHLTSITASFESLAEELTFEAPQFPREHYKWGSIPQWDHQHKTLLIWGESGLGKTSLGVYLLSMKAKIYSQIDDLRTWAKLQTHYDGFILDDMNFMGSEEDKKGRWPDNAQIHLVDTAYERSIRCRYHNARIPPRTKKIITSNLEPRRVLNLSEKAISRRVTVWRMVLNKKGTKAKVKDVDIY